MTGLQNVELSFEPLQLMGNSLIHNCKHLYMYTHLDSIDLTFTFYIHYIKLHNYNLHIDNH